MESGIVYIIDEYSLRSVLVNKDNVSDFIGWYRITYDANDKIVSVIEITEEYISSLKFKQSGEVWSITSTYTTNKASSDDPNYDFRFGTTTGKFAIDLISRKFIYPNEYESSIGWYKVIRDELKQIVDVVLITEDMFIPIYFNEPVWEVTKEFRYVNRDDKGFVFYSEEPVELNDEKVSDDTGYVPVESVIDYDTTPDVTEPTSDKFEEKKLQRLKNNPTVTCVEYAKECVTEYGNTYDNPYYNDSNGRIKRFKVDVMT